MDKTLAALYAVSVIGKSAGDQADTDKPPAVLKEEQTTILKNYFTKLKNLVDRLRR